MNENFAIPLRIKIYSSKYPNGHILKCKTNATVSDVTSFGENVATKFDAKNVLIQTENGTWISIYTKESSDKDILASLDDFDEFDKDGGYNDVIRQKNSLLPGGYKAHNELDYESKFYDSIQIEDCQNCDIEFSKKKIINKNFKDSKCDVIESKKSLRFIGKTEDVISTIAQAMDKTEDDIIEMIINKI